MNNSQIRLIQIAARAAGLRTKYSDARYRVLLSQYKRSGGGQVTSCKHLSNSQMEDFLAICESLGFRYQGKPDDYFRAKVAGRRDGIASYAQQRAIENLAGDLGWNKKQMDGFISKMTKTRTANLVELTPAEAAKIIEGLKNIFSRPLGKKYSSLTELKRDMEVRTNDKKTSQAG